MEFFKRKDSFYNFVGDIEPRATNWKHKMIRSDEVCLGKHFSMAWSTFALVRLDKTLTYSELFILGLIQAITGAIFGLRPLDNHVIMDS